MIHFSSFFFNFVQFSIFFKFPIKKFSKKIIDSNFFICSFFQNSRLVRFTSPEWVAWWTNQNTDVKNVCEKLKYLLNRSYFVKMYQIVPKFINVWFQNYFFVEEIQNFAIPGVTQQKGGLRCYADNVVPLVAAPVVQRY